MRALPHMSLLVPVLVALAGWCGDAAAQTKAIGPGGVLMAPGPSQPHDFTPGGVGPGGVAVAPGSAARDTNIQRIGPGDIELAPGPAGRIRSGRSVRTQVVAPSSSGIAGTVKAKNHGHKRRARHRVAG